MSAQKRTDADEAMVAAVRPDVAEFHAAVHARKKSPERLATVIRKYGGVESAALLAALSIALRELGELP